ncbi:MAG: hypothetical protein FJ011_17815 [Chloroflexi bacterium]|nr:hypothetical protein [Chloroflexota bacterium]
MSEITHFRGILPPEGYHFLPPPSKASAGGLILNALAPLHGEIDRALARNDQQAALHIAYDALSQVADRLAEQRGDRARPGQVMIHALLVELTPLPLELRPDGTFAEPGAGVQVSYRNWTVEQARALTFAHSLTERFQTLWPGAWIILPGLST